MNNKTLWNEFYNDILAFKDFLKAKDRTLCNIQYVTLLGKWQRYLLESRTTKQENICLIALDSIEHEYTFAKENYTQWVITII